MVRLVFRMVSEKNEVFAYSLHIFIQIKTATYMNFAFAHEEEQC